ncbi:MAG: 2'-5' RNA ligase family protein [Bacillota bacterium]
MDDRLFLVFRPIDGVLRDVEQIQRNLADRYRLYDGPLPPVHVTLCSFVPGVEHPLLETVALVHQVCLRRQPFEVKIRGFSFFPEPYLSVNLAIEDQPILRDLAGEIRSVLASQKIEVPQLPKEWQPHISLVNNVFADHPWGRKEFEEAQAELSEHQYHANWLVTRLELWRPRYEPHLAIVATFPLGKQSPAF